MSYVLKAIFNMAAVRQLEF